jgi:hypothetical protein
MNDDRLRNEVVVAYSMYHREDLRAGTEKLIVSQLTQILPEFDEDAGSFQYSKRPATGRYPQSDEC